MVLLQTSSSPYQRTLELDHRRDAAARALATFDLSPEDRAAAIRLLSNELRETSDVQLQSVDLVLRILDCEYVAHRIMQEACGL